jgi:hypothetical protein
LAQHEQRALQQANVLLDPVVSTTEMRRMLAARDCPLAYNQRGVLGHTPFSGVQIQRERNVAATAAAAVATANKQHEVMKRAPNLGKAHAANAARQRQLQMAVAFGCCKGGPK